MKLKGRQPIKGDQENIKKVLEKALRFSTSFLRANPKPNTNKKREIGENLQTRRRDVKNQGEFRTQSRFRGHIIRKRGKTCELCEAIDFLILDHILPISLGGDQYDEINVQLLCKRCNAEKTGFDHSIINMFKKISVMERIGASQWLFNIDQEKVIQIYYYLKNIHIAAKVRKYA